MNYSFKCPVCGFTEKDFGRKITEQELYCPSCYQDGRKEVKVEKRKET